MKLGVGPGQILDPIIPLGRGMGILFLFLTACMGDQDQKPPTAREVTRDEPASSRNFRGRSYERHIVFLTTRGDSTLVVPWTFTAQTRPGAVDRRIRGWLARSGTWDSFVSEAWEGPPSRVPWRILPWRAARLIVGQEDALERLYFQEGAKSLEVALGDLLVEWTGPRAQIFRIHEGVILLASEAVPGMVLDLTRAWTSEGAPPGDWAFLVSGDSLQLVMEDQAGESDPGGGNYSAWARVEFSQEQWQGIRLAWSETRAFEPARRDIPMSWEIQSPASDLGGTLTAISPFLEAGEGEEPMLPVDALFQVSGTLSLNGRDFPVQGLIRHSQR